MTRRIVGQRAQAQMSEALIRCAMPTYYHRSYEPITWRTQPVYPDTYVYSADDPYDVSHETRAYGKHVYEIDLPEDAVVADTAQPRSPRPGEKWWHTDRSKLGPDDFKTAFEHNMNLPRQIRKFEDHADEAYLNGDDELGDYITGLQSIWQRDVDNNRGEGFSAYWPMVLEEFGEDPYNR